jgi:hypothetical protein
MLKSSSQNESASQILKISVELEKYTTESLETNLLLPKMNSRLPFDSTMPVIHVEPEQLFRPTTTFFHCEQ